MSELIKRINEVITYIKVEEMFSLEEMDKIKELQNEITTFLIEIIKRIKP